MRTDGEPTQRATTLWRSFGHAWDGLVSAAAQRNMRIHLVAGVLSGSFAAAAPLGALERAAILLCTALVIAAEAGNTALEALVDLHGGPPSEPARIAKDAAAGAVLVLAAASVGVFAIVVAARWGELLDGWRALVPPASAGVGLAGITALLLLPAGRPGWAALPLAAAAVILVTLLGLFAACPPCVLAPAALAGIAFAGGGAGKARR
jgi:diacylglycerol kinase (ATP)